MRPQLKSWRPHLIPACCIAASRASWSGASGCIAVLMPKGESGSRAAARGWGASATLIRVHAVAAGGGFGASRSAGRGSAAHPAAKRRRAVSRFMTEIDFTAPTVTRKLGAGLHAILDLDQLL